jgi:hypothetical protein
VLCNTKLGEDPEYNSQSNLRAHAQQELPTYGPKSVNKLPELDVRDPWAEEHNVNHSEKT